MMGALMAFDPAVLGAFIAAGLLLNKLTALLFGGLALRLLID